MAAGTVLEEAARLVLTMLTVSLDTGANPVLTARACQKILRAAMGEDPETMARLAALAVKMQAKEAGK